MRKLVEPLYYAPSFSDALLSRLPFIAAHFNKHYSTNYQQILFLYYDQFRHYKILIFVTLPWTYHFLFQSPVLKIKNNDRTSISFLKIFIVNLSGNIPSFQPCFAAFSSKSVLNYHNYLVLIYL